MVAHLASRGLSYSEFVGRFRDSDGLDLVLAWVAAGLTPDLLFAALKGAGMGALGVRAAMRDSGAGWARRDWAEFARLRGQIGGGSSRDALPTMIWVASALVADIGGVRQKWERGAWPCGRGGVTGGWGGDAHDRQAAGTGRGKQTQGSWRSTGEQHWWGRGRARAWGGHSGGSSGIWKG